MARVSQGPATHQVARCSACGASNSVPRRMAGKFRCGGCRASLRASRPSGIPADPAERSASFSVSKDRTLSPVVERPNRRTLKLPRGG